MESINQLIKITKNDNKNHAKVLVSTASFSSTTKEVARGNDIVLINGDSLIKLILKYL